MDPSPLLVVPAALWTTAAFVAVVAAMVAAALPGRARRQRMVTDDWSPLGRDFPVVALAASVAYVVVAAVRSQFAPSSAAFGILWPAMAATAVSYAAGLRSRPLPRWAGVTFAATGAALYGSLPI
ncbi:MULTISPECIES: hypothetical protein [unclassified Streptomyces]|uniref:hypothetical protein n=1 Tax=unclassified Streptomyces TaxID=2593676 RepID=UPI00236563BF|nr:MULTISPECIES: hypothetical protein [unclassified Streptomyces]MDF3146092.1 hypothetical protein [Streptomyces sp. T21Q-yed]WDF37202.1 hypothetical protein PBV52_10605 [Streptomyces sp. T12]